MAKFAIILLLVARAASAALPNVVPLYVGGVGTNNPYVSVTICVPGTKNCQTIDKIMLDTASSGLRIFASRIQLQLPVETDASGATVAECSPWAGGDAYWGPVRRADVRLGGDVAFNIPLQTMDLNFRTSPKGCGNPDANPSSPSDANGLIGVNFVPDDRDGSTLYYSCPTGGACTAITPTQYVPNPIAQLNHDNNGVLVRLPNVPAAGMAKVTGEMILGVGTSTNNLLDPMAITVTHTGLWEAFDIEYQNKQYWSWLDSGTYGIGLPNAAGFPVCKDWQPNICPGSSVTVDAQILNADGTVAKKLSLKLVDADSLNSQLDALPGLAMEWGGGMADGFVLGVPFFYGKTIYIGMAGMTNPLGQTAFTGYSCPIADPNCVPSAPSVGAARFTGDGVALHKRPLRVRPGSF